MSKICEKHSLPFSLITICISIPSLYRGCPDRHCRMADASHRSKTCGCRHVNRPESHVAAVMSVDLSRTFDSVDHDILLTKLSWYGIDPTWFRSYLDGRRQAVRGGSLILPLSHGVPQGSLVGPILFRIFTNDNPSYLPHGRLVSYADDTQLLDSAHPENLSILKARQEEALLTVQSFFTSNSLKMNPAKTTLLLGRHFSASRRHFQQS